MKLSLLTYSALLTLVLAQDVDSLASSILGGIDTLTDTVTSSVPFAPSTSFFASSESAAPPSASFAPGLAPSDAPALATGLAEVIAQYPEVESALSDFAASQTFALSQDLAALTTESGYSSAASAYPTLASFVSAAEDLLLPFSGSIPVLSGTPAVTAAPTITATGTAPTPTSSSIHSVTHSSGAGALPAVAGTLAALVGVAVAAAWL